MTFSTNAARITEGEEIVFTAVVTDPDGINDLIGGSLRNPDTGATYGAFATTASEGAYELTLSWADIHRTQTIEFTEETPRTFRANFFDQAGNIARETITLALHCEGLGACDGDCINRTTPANCGACGNQCDAFQVCQDSACTCAAPRLQCNNNCIDPGDDIANCGACGIACRSDQTCAQGQCQCPEGEIECDGVCIDPTNDDDNCGSCGNECLPNTSGCTPYQGGSCGCFVNNCENNKTCIEHAVHGNAGIYTNICVEPSRTRLIGGDSVNEGFVQMNVNGSWLNVCPIQQNVARVACHEVAGNGTGDGTYVSHMARDNTNVPGDLPMTVDRLNCTSNLGNLIDCPELRIDDDCHNDDSLYVRCGYQDNSDLEYTDETCSDNIDNDGDGAGDCGEFTTCGYATPCVFFEELCLPGGFGMPYNRIMRNALDINDFSDANSGGRYYDVWNASMTPGQEYVITLFSPSFDTVLHILEGDECTTLVTDDDGQGNGTTDSRLTYVPTTSGRKIIIATSYNPAETGTYTLRLAPTPWSPPGLESCFPPEETIELNEITSGRLQNGPTDGPRDGAYYNSYTFTPDTSRTHTIDVVADFDSYLYIFENNSLDGEECTNIAENDDHPSSSSSQIEQQLTRNVRYTIVVTSYHSNDTGTYNLRVE